MVGDETGELAASWTSKWPASKSYEWTVPFQGADVDAVLLVGSVYLRDLVLPKFNFKIEDITDQW